MSDFRGLIATVSSGLVSGSLALLQPRQLGLGLGLEVRDLLLERLDGLPGPPGVLALLEDAARPRAPPSWRARGSSR